MIRKSFRAKFYLLLLGIFLVLGLGLSLLQYQWVHRLTVEYANKRMKQHIRTAWALLDERRERLTSVAGFLAGEAPEAGLEPGPALRDWLQEAERRWDLDFVFVLDPGGEVIGRSGSRERGDRFEVTAAYSGRRADSGYATISHEAIAKAGDDLADRATLSGEPVDAMIVFASEPIRRPGGAIEGWLVTGRLLNRANDLVDEIKTTVFPDETYEGRQTGTATIFMDDIRVATTVREEGERKIGTRVSEEVAKQVLYRGEPWTGPARVVSHDYLTRYEPIRNPSETIIGMLYIGELEAIHIAQRNAALFGTIGVIIVVMAAALAASYFILKGLMRQFRALEHATNAFAHGDFSARAEVRSEDEVGQLAVAFNRMAGTIEADRAEILEQKRETDQANRNYLDMLGFITHELRSTVAAALFNAQLLKDGSFGKLTTDQKEGVNVVHGSLEYLEDITSNYLQLSRIEKDEVEPDMSRITVCERVIEPVVQDLRARLKERDMRLENKIPDTFVVRGDVTLLRMVYDNLIGNAIKYGREGGRIVLAAKVQGDRILMSVWNEGKGIPPEQTGKLFEKFQRFDVDESTGRAGSGLGLFIVRKIVEAHGGQVKVRSQPGENAAFIFDLPKA